VKIGLSLGIVVGRGQRIEHLIISWETAVSEEKSKRGKWTPARAAQWWGAILASLAVLGLQIFYYK